MSERAPSKKNVDIRGTEFPRILRKLRESRNLTKAELADKVGMSERAIRLIETGRSKRVLDKTLFVLGEFFGVTRDELLGTAPLPPLNGGRPDRSPAPEPPAPARLRLPAWIKIAGSLAAVAVLVGAFFGVRTRALSQASWKVTGNCISVHDGLLGLTLWEDCHKSPIAKEPDSVKFARWGSERVIAYGLEPGAVDGGTFFVRSIATGKILLQDRPDPLELAAVYDEEVIRNGGFHCQEIHDADLDGDGEFVKTECTGRIFSAAISPTFLSRTQTKTGRTKSSPQERTTPTRTWARWWFSSTASTAAALRPTQTRCLFRSSPIRPRRG
jgi:transcriptional regulator with XRE-family HTH domain